MTLTSMNILHHRVNKHYLSRRLHMEDYQARALENYGKLSLRSNRRLRLDKLVGGVLRIFGLYQLGERVASDFEVKENSVSIPRLHPNLEGLRILHLSDLHFGPETNLLETIQTHIQSTSFDLCVITGDFNVEGGHSYEASMQHLNTLRPLLGEHVFAVLGNHDQFTLVEHIEGMDIKVLLNKEEEFCYQGGSLSLLGVDDPHYFATDDLDALRPLSQANAVLLMSHSTEIYREAERAGVDFIMSGHTHGGQLCLPGGYALMNNSKSPRPFIAGPWRYGRLEGYTSRGASGNSRHLRLFCRPEIVIHELKCSM